MIFLICYCLSRMNVSVAALTHKKNPATCIFVSDVTLMFFKLVILGRLFKYSNLLKNLLKMVLNILDGLLHTNLFDRAQLDTVFVIVTLKFIMLTISLTLAFHVLYFWNFLLNRGIKSDKPDRPSPSPSPRRLRAAAARLITL
ncbi:hypothetical protein ACJX0J_013931 [Zea mays]